MCDIKQMRRTAGHTHGHSHVQGEACDCPERAKVHLIFWFVVSGDCHSKEHSAVLLVRGIPSICLLTHYLGKMPILYQTVFRHLQKSTSCLASHHRLRGCLQRSYAQQTQKIRILDQAIPYDIVRTVDDSNIISPPTPLSDVLASLMGISSKGRQTAVREAELVRDPSPELGGYALVRIKIKPEKDRQYIQEQRQRRLDMRKKLVTKEVQLSVTAAPADVAHKMRKIRMEVENGHRVALAVVQKSKGPQVPMEEGSEIVSSWLKEVADVAKEWAPRKIAKSLIVVHLQHIDREIPKGSMALLKQAGLTGSLA